MVTFFQRLSGRYRQATRHAARMLTLHRRLLAKQDSTKLTAEARTQLVKSAAETRECMNAGDVASLEEATAELERLLVLYLAHEPKAAWRESVESIAVAIALALFLRAFVVEAFKIPSGSMIPSLSIGDQIFVNKFIYGPRIPFTMLRPLPLVKPGRGEVVVFISPLAPHDDYIKRIIGIAGDTVEVRSGKVWVNGQQIERRPLGLVQADDRDSTGSLWRTVTANAYRESLDGHVYNAFEEVEPIRRAPDFLPTTVPAHHVLVMGDNRDHSYDSRAWGMVPEENILGRAMFVWWSWGRHQLDWRRLGTWIR